MQQWDEETHQFIEKPIPMGGKLFFKIVDSYYKDNVGGYNIKIMNGVTVSKYGPIERMMQFFTYTLGASSKKLYINLVKDSWFRKITNILLLLSATFTSVFFMLGLVEMNQKEFLVRILKLGAIITLISDKSLEVMPKLILSISVAIVNISKDIMQASLLDPETNTMLLPIQGSVFSVYDNVLHMVTSEAFNAKVLGLLFTSKFYLVIGIYWCIAILFFGLWRSFVAYLTSFFVLSLLLIIFPMYLVMILFKTTKSMFNDWITRFIAACLNMIVITVSIGLLLSLALVNIESLLHYTVCWKEIFSIDLFRFVFKFWKPQDFDAFNHAVTAGHFFYTLIASILFRVYMSYAPQLTDILVGTPAGGYGGFYQSLAGQISKGMDTVYNKVTSSTIYKYTVGKAVDALNTLTPLSVTGLLVETATNDYIKRTDVMGWPSKIMGMYNKTTSYTSAIYKKFTGTNQERLGAYSIAEEEEKQKLAMKQLKQNAKNAWQAIKDYWAQFSNWTSHHWSGRASDLKKLNKTNKSISDKLNDIEQQYDTVGADKAALDQERQVLEQEKARYDALQNQIDINEHDRKFTESYKERLERHKSAQEKYNKDIHEWHQNVKNASKSVKDYHKKANEFREKDNIRGAKLKDQFAKRIDLIQQKQELLIKPPAAQQDAQPQNVENN